MSGQTTEYFRAFTRSSSHAASLFRAVVAKMFNASRKVVIIWFLAFLHRAGSLKRSAASNNSMVHRPDSPANKAHAPKQPDNTMGPPNEPVELVELMCGTLSRIVLQVSVL